MEWTILSFLRREMVKKGASKDELDVLKECEKKISNLYLKYGKVIEARSLKETGHTVAEIQEELKLDTVEVRPMKEESMTKEQKDKILKTLVADRNDYARDCNRRVATENGKIIGADYMLQRFLDVLSADVEPQEIESEEDKSNE